MKRREFLDVACSCLAVPLAAVANVFRPEIAKSMLNREKRSGFVHLYYVGDGRKIRELIFPIDLEDGGEGHYQGRFVVPPDPC